MKKLGITGFNCLTGLLMGVSCVYADELTSEEITRLFTGNTVSAISESAKVPVSLYYDKSGEVRGLFASGKLGKSRWWVSNKDQLCLKGKKGDMCFSIVKSGSSYEKYTINERGERTLVFSTETVSSGNINNY